MPSSASTQTLARQLREVISLYLSRQRRHAHEQGLSQSDRLLMLLHRHGPATQTDFGRLAGLDKSWISRIVERYVEEGLVERQPLATDRRCIELHLTAEGLEKARRCDSALTAYAEGFFGTIPSDEHARLENALGLIMSTLQAQSQEKV